MRRYVGIVIFTLLVASALAQDQRPAPMSSAAAPLAFEAADVHVAPVVPNPAYRGAFLRGNRYILRQATLADLVSTSYGLKQTNLVGGGPSWIVWDRYDVEAQVPPGTTPETATLMLRNLLAERLKLVVHPGDVPVPAYLLTVTNGKPNLRPSNSGAEGSCQLMAAATPEPGAVPMTTSTNSPRRTNQRGCW